MIDTALSAGGLVLALVLVVLNGFFVAAEFAYVRVRSTAVDQLVEEGRAGAETLQSSLADLDDYLAVTQLGITLSSLGLGWVGEPAVAALIEPWLATVLPDSVIHLVAFALGFAFITFLHVVFGELAPKTIAIAQAERIALLVAPPLRVCYYLFLPGLVVFNGTANAFTSAIGIPPASETEETLSEEEILTVLARSGRKGEIAHDEVEMIERVFDLDDLDVRQIMVPRPDVVSVPADLSLTELRRTIVDVGHTRYPVVETDDPNRIVGFLDAKDVLGAMEEDGGAGETGADRDDRTGDDLTAGDIAREVPVVPETSRVDELLAVFQRERSQLAAIVDEWGAFEGIATVEDVLEVVVGDIRDQFDGDEPDRIVERRPGTYSVDGGAPLSAVNDALDAGFEAAGYATIGGLVLDRLGRVPEPGDEVPIDDVVVRVEAVDGKRVSRVEIRREEGGDESAE